MRKILWARENILGGKEYTWQPANEYGMPPSGRHWIRLGDSDNMAEAEKALQQFLEN